MTEQLQANEVAAETAANAKIETKLRLESELKNGASWFYWIAGLSLINSILFMTGSKFGFIFGLGVTQVIDGLGASTAETVGNGAKVFSLLINCVLAAVYIVFGVFSNKRFAWAFIIGLVFYGLDGILCLLAQDWLSVAFHAFAGFSIFKGMQAGKQLDKMENL